MIFREEKSSNDFYDELGPLLKLHHAEISQYPEMKLQPNFTVYTQLSRQGFLKFFTVRDDSHALVGYSIFFIIPCMHLLDLKATQDVLFIHPDHRGRGHHFMRYCEEQLKAAGVNRIFIAYNQKLDLSPILRRHGYEICETTYCKKIGSP